MDQGRKTRISALRLFGEGAAKSWTVAVMSGLKDMAVSIQRGRLRYVLSTAMPLRDDFKLLDGDEVPPSKLAEKRIEHGTWEELKGIASTHPERGRS